MPPYPYHTDRNVFVCHPLRHVITIRYPTTNQPREFTVPIRTHAYATKPDDGAHNLQLHGPHRTRKPSQGATIRFGLVRKSKPPQSFKNTKINYTILARTPPVGHTMNLRPTQSSHLDRCHPHAHPSPPRGSYRRHHPRAISTATVSCAIHCNM